MSYSYEECRKALGKMIILDELPFNFVENQRFKSFNLNLILTDGWQAIEDDQLH